MRHVILAFSAVTVALHAHGAAAQAPATPFLLQPVLEAAATAAASAPALAPGSQPGRQEYLSWAHGVASYFTQFQAASGAIIDPFAGEEIQYATPCYAYTCLVSVANNMTIGGLSPSASRDSCARAMNSSVYELASSHCASASCNFFTKPMMLMYRLALSRPDLVPAGLVAQWATVLETVNPYDAYHGFQEDNWGLVAAGGEYLRDVLGINTNSSWYKAEISKQVHQDKSWTPNGEYQDHTGFDGVLNPMPYDLFARSYLSFMLAEHYDGADFAFINDTMTRAAMTSLLLQSPKGEWPTGGRSSQHQWNEAVSILVYEIWATRFAKAAEAGVESTYGVPNKQLACMLKRASNLALSSLHRWVNTTDGSNDVQVVKNWFPPQDRFGYEGYSFLTQYNLMPAAMVASSLLYMDDTIDACPSLADAGGYVFELPNYHKVFANAGGTYVEFETGSDPHYDSTGLQRIHTSAQHRDPLIGPTAGPAWKDGAVAVGPFWTMRQGCDARVPQVDSLANATFQDVSAVTLTQQLTPNASVVSFSIDYALVDKAVTVREAVTVVASELVANLNLPPIPSGYTEAGVVRVDATVQRLRECDDGGAPFSSVGVEFTAMLFDGRTNYTTIPSYANNTALVQSVGGAVEGAAQYWVPEVSDSIPWKWAGAEPPYDIRNTRNGHVTRVTAGLTPETAEPSFTFYVRMLASA